MGYLVTQMLMCTQGFMIDAKLDHFATGLEMAERLKGSL